MLEPKTVSARLIYQADAPHDEQRPEYDCYNPVETGRWWMVDCWPCTQAGEIHPGYNVAPVPVHTNGLLDPVGAMSTGPLWEETADSEEPNHLTQITAEEVAFPGFDVKETVDGEWMILCNGIQWGESPLDASGCSSQVWETKELALASWYDQLAF